MHRALKQGLLWGIIGRNPSDAVTLPKYKPREMKVGLIVRANGRLGVITDINDVITVKFPTGTKTSYPTNKVTFCRDQEKAKTQHQNLIDRRNK